MYYVYRFLDKDKNIIYVGKSKQSLEQRFSGHTHLPEECYSQVYQIEYIECSNEADMSIKEIFYINKYRKGKLFYNVLDVSEVPSSVDFNDKWSQYIGTLGSNFPNSENFIRGYKNKQITRYNKDGSIDRRTSPKQKGITTYTEGFSPKEVNLVMSLFLDSLKNATTPFSEQSSFRNLLIFIFGINLPLKTHDLLNLKVLDVIGENDYPKTLSYQSASFDKDTLICIPLRTVVTKALCAYLDKYHITFDKNANDYLFASKKGQNPISTISYSRILAETAAAAGISKQIGAESLRKTYGLNIYNQSNDKLNALLFLGNIWGREREAHIIDYLNLTKLNIDYNYYYGETFSLGYFEMPRLSCMKSCEATLNNHLKSDTNFNRNTTESLWSEEEKN